MPLVIRKRSRFVLGFIRIRLHFRQLFMFVHLSNQKRCTDVIVQCGHEDHIRWFDTR